MSYWGAMYIPVVVAMAVQQNVVAALHGGPVALLAAFGERGVCGRASPSINRTGRRHASVTPPDLEDNPKRSNAMLEILEKAAKENGLVAAFAVVGLVMMVSGLLSRKLTFGRVHGSAIAILIGLAMAYMGRQHSPAGTKGLADICRCSAASA